MNLIVALLLGGSLGCSIPAAAEQTKLVYALPITVPAVIPYLALDKGFFKQEGLDVEAKMFSSGREALQALLAGQAQIQSVSETPVVHAIIQGNEIVTVATVARHQEAKLLVRKDRGISKPEDLKGKKIATLPGTNSDYFMHRLLRAHGLTSSDLMIANMPPPEMIVSFVKGDIDGYFAWEPHITYGKNQLPDAVMIPPGELYRGWTTVNMSPKFVRDNPETVRKIIRAFLQAEAFAKKNPDEAIKLAARRLKIDATVLRSLWKENAFTVELDRGLLESMASEGEWALGLSKTEAPLPKFRDHIYEKALARERPSAVKL